MDINKKFPDPVTIVLPAYNEEHCVRQSLEALAGYCRNHFRWFEIVCVDDGSTDGTWDLMTQMCSAPHIRAIRLPKNRGKGYAVRQGMLHARGRFRFFTDIDLPYSLDAFAAAMESFYQERCDLVTGARDLPGSSHGTKSRVIRRGASRAFSAIARRLVKIGVRDSQCGFKGFTDAASRRIFSRLQTTGFAFDVEIFALARAWNMNVCKIPVTLVRHDCSTIRLVRDPFVMLLDIIKLSRRKIVS